MGKSKAFILPEAILDKYSIVDKIELILQNDCIILKPKLQPRKNWEKAFKAMHKMATINF